MVLLPRSNLLGASLVSAQKNAIADENCIINSNGLRLVLADIDEQKLAAAGKAVAAIVGDASVLTVVTDVSKLEDVKRLKERAYEAFGEVSFPKLA